MSERAYVQLTSASMDSTATECAASPEAPRREDKGEPRALSSWMATSTLTRRIAVNFAGREIDRETGTLMIEAEFPNPEKTVRPGQFARDASSVTEIRKNATLVPQQRSVMELQGIYQVYVIDDRQPW